MNLREDTLYRAHPQNVRRLAKYLKINEAQDIPQIIENMLQQGYIISKKIWKEPSGFRGKVI